MSDAPDSRLAQIKARAATKPQRFDRVTSYSCGSSSDEMEREDEGDWLRYEDVAAVLESDVPFLIEQVEGKGWQPIETAPKDGTWIVAVGRLRHEPRNWRACLTRWCQPDQPPVYAEGWSFGAPGYSDLFDPEWWLPQPEPRTPEVVEEASKTPCESK